MTTDSASSKAAVPAACVGHRTIAAGAEELAAAANHKGYDPLCLNGAHDEGVPRSAKGLLRGCESSMLVGTPGARTPDGATSVAVPADTGAGASGRSESTSSSEHVDEIASDPLDALRSEIAALERRVALKQGLGDEFAVPMDLVKRGLCALERVGLLAREP